MKKGFKNVDFLRRGFPFCFFLLAFILGFSSSPSSAFAFRRLEIGKRAPDIQLKDVDGKEFTLSSIKGKKIVLLFWGTDTAVKEKRSLSIMKRLETLYQRFKGEGFEFISIISDPDSRKKIKALKQQISLSHFTLLDEKREVYGAYGVYILPTVGIFDEEKRLLKALPYTHTLEEDVDGEVLVAIGKKTAKEWEKERHPKETLLPENKGKAQRHFSFGETLFGKGLIGKAKEEFLSAIKLDPDYGEAYVGLGMVHLKEKNPEEAFRFFEKGVSLNPSLRQGHLGLALVFEARGQNSKAIEKLEEWLKTGKGTPEIHFHLGRFYEKEGLKEKAFSEYKKALQFFFKEE